MPLWNVTLLRFKIFEKLWFPLTTKLEGIIKFSIPSQLLKHESPIDANEVGKFKSLKGTQLENAQLSIAVSLVLKLIDLIEQFLKQFCLITLRFSGRFKAIILNEFSKHDSGSSIKLSLKVVSCIK